MPGKVLSCRPITRCSIVHQASGRRSRAPYIRGRMLSRFLSAHVAARGAILTGRCFARRSAPYPKRSIQKGREHRFRRPGVSKRAFQRGCFFTSISRTVRPPGTPLRWRSCSSTHRFYGSCLNCRFPFSARYVVWADFRLRICVLFRGSPLDCLSFVVREAGELFPEERASTIA